jgi:hypothetical protein
MNPTFMVTSASPAPVACYFRWSNTLVAIRADVIAVG